MSARALGAGAALLLSLAAVAGALAAAAGGRGHALPPPPPDDVPPALALGPPRGAPLVVVFSDYECPACAALESGAGAQLRAWAAQGRLRLELRHAPLPAHRAARQASLWAICAARRGHGWEMHEALLASAAWRRPGQSARGLAELADSLGMHARTMEACAREPDTAAELAADLGLARAAGVAAVPSVHVDGQAWGPTAPRVLLRALERRLPP